MTVDWPSALAVLNLVLIVAGAAGFYVVLRSGISRASLEVQERVRTALLDENTLLNARLNRVEEDNQHLKELFSTMTSALEQEHGLIVTINGDLVTIKDASGKRSSSVRKRPPKATIDKTKEDL